MSDYDNLLQILAANDGACLYWQLDKSDVQAALGAGVVRQVDELIIHPDAIELEPGMSYTMKR